MTDGRDHYSSLEHKKRFTTILFSLF